VLIYINIGRPGAAHHPAQIARPPPDADLIDPAHRIELVCPADGLPALRAAVDNGNGDLRDSLRHALELCSQFVVAPVACSL
jgi:hypothetical protein